MSRLNAANKVCSPPAPSCRRASHGYRHRIRLGFSFPSKGKVWSGLDPAALASLTGDTMADSVIADGGAMATDAADYPAPATAITAPSTVESKAGNRQRMRSEMATSSPLESPAQAMPAAKEQSQAQAQASEPQAPPQPRRSTRASNTAAAAAAASSKALRSGGAHDRSDSDEGEWARRGECEPSLPRDHIVASFLLLLNHANRLFTQTSSYRTRRPSSSRLYPHLS